MDIEIQKYRHAAVLTALLSLSLLLSGFQAAGISENEFCDSGSFGDTCIVYQDQQLTDGETVTGNNLVLNSTLNSTGKFTLNFTGTVKFKSEARLEGNADIYSDEILKRGNISLGAGSPGNFFICERTSNVSCISKADSGTSLNTSYSRTSDRAVHRKIQDNWSKGYLNWTDDLSLTEQLDPDFSGTNVVYNTTKLLEEQVFEIWRNGTFVDEKKTSIKPEKLNKSSFLEENSENLTAGENLQLEIASKTNNTIGGKTSSNKNDWEVLMQPQSDLKLTSTVFYSERVQQIEFELIDESGNVERQGDFTHTGSSSFERFTFNESLLVESNTNYTFRATFYEKGYYGQDFGSYGLQDNIKWIQNPDTLTSEPAIGVEILEGYKEKGFYNSSALDAGEKVEWMESSLKGDLPPKTTADLTYGENSSGEWYYSENPDDISESQFIRFNLTLRTNKSFRTPEINEVVLDYNPPGPDGFLNFSTVISEANNFQILETEDPLYFNPAQEKELIGARQSNNLSADLEDPGSGLDNAILATNETGQVKNRTKYLKNFDHPQNVSTRFEWSNESLKGVIDDIAWQVWLRDAAGNWNSTDTKTFQLDGKGPVFSSLDYSGYVDIDHGETTVSAFVEDTVKTTDTVKFEENSSSEFTNYTLGTGRGEYSQKVTHSDLGKVNFTFYANDTLENWNSLSRTINFQNISINSSISDPDRNMNVSIGENTAISGTVKVKPSGEPQDYGNVTVEVEDGETKNFSVNSGSYSGQIKTFEPGNKTVNITYENQNGIKGSDTTYFYAYNLSARIENVEIESGQGGGLQVYKDNDVDNDIYFNDNVTADVENIFPNHDIYLTYDYPQHWSPSINPEIGTLNPGESAENSPSFNIEPSAEIGPHQINISTETREDIVSSDNVTVEVWSESESDYNNLKNDQSLNRANNFYNVTANVTDVYSGEKLDGINVTLHLGLGSPHSYDISNSSGVVELPINLSQLGTDPDVRVTMQTHDNEEYYINSTEDIFSNEAIISILGKMQQGSESDISPVYRENGFSNSTTIISGEIEDSTGTSLEDATTYLSIGEEVLGPQKTSSQGLYSYSYNPPRSITPGIYNATINASKDQFDPFMFNRSVEVRGELDIENLVDRNIVQRGLSFNGISHVENEFGEKTSGNVSWYMNSTKVGGSENTSIQVPIELEKGTLEKGTYDLKASTNRKFFEDDSSTQKVEIYGLAEVELKPEDFTIRPGNTVTLRARVTEDNTSENVSNYPVKFKIDETTYTRKTDSSGVATFNWDVSEGYHDITAEIEDNSSLMYNVTNSKDKSEVFVGDKLFLDKYELSNKEIYRYLNETGATKTAFNINLTRTSNTINRVPVENEEIHFTINGSRTLSCTTDSTGKCSEQLVYAPVDYDPVKVSAGNLTVEATTDKENWIDLNDVNTINAQEPKTNLIVRGKLFTSINNPQGGANIARGDKISLSATTETDNQTEVERNLTWYIDGDEISYGYETEWTVPTDKSTGKADLTAVGNGEFFVQGASKKEIWILGKADAKLISPSNDSKIGYAEPVQMTCEVASQQGETINNYPVEFVENSSGSLQVFATAKTENADNGYQTTAEWQPPEEITSVKTGCRIDDNRTVGYTAETPLDTQVYETKDDKPPEISNLESPTRVDPGDTATVEFNASDESGGIDTGSIEVEVTAGFSVIDESEIDVIKTEGTGYRINIETQSSSTDVYDVEITVTDPSGNEAPASTQFNVQPGGSLNLDNRNIDANNITYSKGLTEKVSTSFKKLNKTGYNLKINVSSDRLEFNQTEYACGDIPAGNYCNRTFNVTVPPGAAPTGSSAIYADFRAIWEKSSNQDAETTVMGNRTEIEIASNPLLEEQTGDRIIPDIEDNNEPFNLSTGSNPFQLYSYGNIPIDDYSAVYIEDNLSADWIQLYNKENNTISPGSLLETDMGIDVPTGTSPGVYTGSVEFRTSNVEKITQEVSVEILSRPKFKTPQEVNASAVKGSTGLLEEITFNSTGNIDLSLSYSAGNKAGDVNSECAPHIGPEWSLLDLDKQSSEEIEIRYNFTDVSFAESKNICEPVLTFEDENSGVSSSTTFDTNLLNFTIDASQEFSEAYPGDRRSLSFQTSIGNENRTDNISFDVLIGGVSTRNITSETRDERFHVNYTVPEVPDARYHDVTVVAEDLENGVENSKSLKDKIYVPDFSPPHFGNFNIQGADPGETQEIEVPVSDNSGTVENVSMRLEGPENVSNYSLSKVTGEEKWSVSIPDVEKSVYRANFTAFDPSGFSSSVVDTFRVSSNTTFDGSFTTPEGGANSGADLVFTDSETSRSVPVNIGGSGSYSVDLKEGNYDVAAEFEGQQVNMENTPVNENTSGFRAEKLSEVETSGLTPSDSTAERVMGIGVDTGLEPESATITFNYSGVSMPSGYEISELEVARCPDYNYGSLTCDSSSFETFEVGRLDVNKARKTITVEVSGFSSYTLFAPAESSNESDDQQDQPDDSGGGGGGGGGLPEDAFEDLNESVSETQEEVENLSDRLNDTTETPGAELGSSSINAELRPGEKKTVSLSVSNTANDSQTFVFGVDDVLSDYVSVSDTVTLESGESRDVLLNISAPADELAGSYSGTLSIESDEINTNIPVNVQILPPQDKLLDMSLNPVFSSVEPGDALQVEATFSNQGYARNVDVTAVIDVLDPDTNETIASLEETVAVGTTLNRVFEIDIPEDTSLKSYAIRGSARYTNLDVSRVATAASSFEVDQPFWSRDIFGFTYGNIALGFLLLVLASAIGFSIYYYRKKQALKKKRYMENIDLDTIPSGGNNQAYLGELAEVGTRTFLQLDDLTTHALIAGATGSGKTVTGQVMVEEALENGANVIVLDPTAQWTGYLRENKDPNMLDLYDDYGMSQSDARAFDGNIRAVEPGEDIDITPYLEQDEDGQIIIFSLHKLDSKNIDEFANRTIQQIFDANLPERNGLETIIVYDEVHRLLEKFGGNGEGLKQLERGAREFRKWGVGMVLLSQVISDFSGEIRANIGTTIQMRTQYDDDLERIREKFGIDTVKSIAKAEVGSGMLQNSDYNHGRPYFVDFRPLLHSPHRLSDEELEKYEDYNKRIDAIEERVDQLEEQGEDVYEYRSELKLTKRNLKKGSFSLVDTYIEELEEKLDI